MSRREEREAHIGVPRHARGAREKRAAAWLAGAYYRGPSPVRIEQPPIPIRDENGVLPEPVRIEPIVPVVRMRTPTPGKFTARSYLARTGIWAEDAADELGSTFTTLHATPRLKTFDNEAYRRAVAQQSVSKANQKITDYLKGRTPLPFMAGAVKSLVDGEHRTHLILDPTKDTKELISQDINELRSELGMGQTSNVRGLTVATFAPERVKHAADTYAELTEYVRSLPDTEPHLMLSPPELY